jgi:hypothetical protein
VEELILVGSPDELFEQGLAVDRLDSVQVVEADSSKGEMLLQKLQERFVVQSVSKPAR